VDEADKIVTQMEENATSRGITLFADRVGRRLLIFASTLVRLAGISWSGRWAATRR